MFPNRPRRPMPPRGPNRPMPNRRPIQGPPAKAKPSVLDQFKTADGKFDMEKITTTAQQVYGIYGQVSPMIRKMSPLLANFIKK